MAELTGQESVTQITACSSICLVTEPDGSEKIIPAFWAGEQVWKVRYSSDIIGEHRAEVHCSDSSNTDLNGRETLIEVTKYKGDNPLLQHGPLRASAKGRYFEHADGTPFFWLGDTR